MHECAGKAYHRLGIWGQWDPCSRSATVQRDGKWYCWQHDPERVKADEEKRRADWDAKRDRELAKYKRIARNAKLGALVTMETAGLLERLGKEADLSYEKAGDNGDSHTGWAIQLHHDAKAALALAASIREVLEASK